MVKLTITKSSTTKRTITARIAPHMNSEQEQCQE